MREWVCGESDANEQSALPEWAWPRRAPRTVLGLLVLRGGARRLVSWLYQLERSVIIGRPAPV